MTQERKKCLECISVMTQERKKCLECISVMTQERNIWEKIMDRLVLYSREKLRCIEEPSYAIVDSRSTKTHNRFEEIGFDGYKKNKRYKSPTS